jgi:hypothetical protein
MHDVIVGATDSPKYGPRHRNEIRNQNTIVSICFGVVVVVVFGPQPKKRRCTFFILKRICPLHMVICCGPIGIVSHERNKNPHTNDLCSAQFVVVVHAEDEGADDAVDFAIKLCQVRPGQFP